MMVKCYGYNSVKHGMDFAQDLKLGQYMVRQTPFCVHTETITNPGARRKSLPVSSLSARYILRYSQLWLKSVVSTYPQKNKMDGD